MVVERFIQGPEPVYRRAAERGRMLPPGLEYIDSWVDERLDRCFQLMETEDPGLFDQRGPQRHGQHPRPGERVVVDRSVLVVEGRAACGGQVAPVERQVDRGVG